MKNIQVIDGANNCRYPIYSATELDFATFFPNPEQDVAFVEEFIKATGQKKAKEILNRLWSNEQNKKDVHGIHGTLFYESLHKKPYYPDRTEKNMVVSL